MASTRHIVHHNAHQMKLRIHLWKFLNICYIWNSRCHTTVSRSQKKKAAFSHNSLWQHLLFWHSPDALENMRTTPIGDDHFLLRTKHFGGRRGRNHEQRQLKPLASPFDLGFVKEGCEKALLSDGISLWWVVWLFKCSYRCALAVMALNYTDRVIFIKYTVTRQSSLRYLGNDYCIFCLTPVFIFSMWIPILQFGQQSFQSLSSPDSTSYITSEKIGITRSSPYQ